MASKSSLWPPSGLGWVTLWPFIVIRKIVICDNNAVWQVWGVTQVVTSSEGKLFNDSLNQNPSSFDRFSCEWNVFSLSNTNTHNYAAFWSIFVCDDENFSKLRIWPGTVLCWEFERDGNMICLCQIWDYSSVMSAAMISSYSWIILSQTIAFNDTRGVWSRGPWYIVYWLKSIISDTDLL